MAGKTFLEKESDLFDFALQEITPENYHKVLTDILYFAVGSAGTAGSHHKQYGLNEIIKLLLGNHYSEWRKIMAEYGYDIDEGEWG